MDRRHKIKTAPWGAAINNEVDFVITSLAWLHLPL